MVAAGSIHFVRHEDGIRKAGIVPSLRHPAHPCNTLIADLGQRIPAASRPETGGPTTFIEPDSLGCLVAVTSFRRLCFNIAQRARENPHGAHYARGGRLGCGSDSGSDRIVCTRSNE
jgi:hypothetical protein